MIDRLKRYASFYYHGINDWTTKRKIVVIESDDWGSIRMPSRETYENLLTKGYPVDIRPSDRFDSIESNDDFDVLYSVLRRFRDSNGSHPKITANFIVGNPDFEKIEREHFSKFYVEDFLKTYSRYDNISFSVVEQGIDENLLFPQLHGREHVNPFTWMSTLANDESPERQVFSNGLMGVPLKEKPGVGNIHQATFNSDFRKVNVREYYQKSIDDAQKLFMEFFGFQSMSFIAPVYTWNGFIEQELRRNNVLYLQGGRFQKLPYSDAAIKHHTSEVNQDNNMMYLVRNAYFEPSNYVDYSKRESILADVIEKTKMAFGFGKPLIFSVHRFNFIGRIFEENRAFNILLLDKYLSWLTKNYSDVEFFSTVQLAQLINYEISNS